MKQRVFFTMQAQSLTIQISFIVIFIPEREAYLERNALKMQ
jgi:hypothetical protein